MMKTSAQNEQIDGSLRRATETGIVPGIVAIVGTDSDVIYEGAFGKRDLSHDRPMTSDSVFWIASLTKAITATAAMQLVEQGKLSLDEPISRLLPELAKPMVLEGFGEDGAPKLRPAKGTITLRKLLTHTAGFCYDIWNADMAAYIEKTGTVGILTCKNAALRIPLASDPGTRWEYGINMDLVGKAVEAASGKRLDAYMREHIFAPLGMNDTAFKINPDMRRRLVSMHARQPDGSAKPIPFEVEQEPEFHTGGAGLYGTARDYLAFAQMFLNKGRVNGHQLLKPETVALVGQNHIGDLHIGKAITTAPPVSLDMDFYPDIPKKMGLSFMINTKRTPEGRSAGSLAWVGLANCYYWIDPSRKLAGVILMQLLPMADRDCLNAFAEFERSVYAISDGNERSMRYVTNATH